MRLFRVYFRHVCTNPRSLLARVYGVYSVTMGDQKPVKLVVMANTMRLNPKHALRYVFDLKGSMINRLVKTSDDLKPSHPLKDQNLLLLVKQHNFLRFSSRDRKHVNDNISLDVGIL